MNAGRQSGGTNLRPVVAIPLDIYQNLQRKEIRRRELLEHPLIKAALAVDARIVALLKNRSIDRETKILLYQKLLSEWTDIQAQRNKGAVKKGAYTTRVTEGVQMVDAVLPRPAGGNGGEGEGGGGDEGGNGNDLQQQQQQHLAPNGEGDQVEEEEELEEVEIFGTPNVQHIMRALPGSTPSPAVAEAAAVIAKRRSSAHREIAKLEKPKLDIFKDWQLLGEDDAQQATTSTGRPLRVAAAAAALVREREREEFAQKKARKKIEKEKKKPK